MKLKTHKQHTTQKIRTKRGGRSRKAQHSTAEKKHTNHKTKTCKHVHVENEPKDINRIRTKRFFFSFFVLFVQLPFAPGVFLLWVRLDLLLSPLFRVVFTTCSFLFAWSRLFLFPIFLCESLKYVAKFWGGTKLKTHPKPECQTLLKVLKKTYRKLLFQGHNTTSGYFLKWSFKAFGNIQHQDFPKVQVQNVIQSKIEEARPA